MHRVHRMVDGVDKRRLLSALTMKAIKRAIRICGSQVELAKKIGVSQALVSRWAAGETPIQPRHFRAIQKATNGKVTPIHLLDDELKKAGIRP